MYPFIRIYGTDDVKPSDNKRRKIIREAATRHGGQSRSSRRHINQRVPRNPIFELEISTEPASSATIIPPIILPLDPGAGRHDPFVRYPVPMSIRMHEIIDQSESITDTPYSPRTAQHVHYVPFHLMLPYRLIPDFSDAASSFNRPRRAFLWVSALLASHRSRRCCNIPPAALQYLSSKMSHPSTNNPRRRRWNRTSWSRCISVSTSAQHHTETRGFGSHPSHYCLRSVQQHMWE